MVVVVVVVVRVYKYQRSAELSFGKSGSVGQDEGASEGVGAFCTIQD